MQYKFIILMMLAFVVKVNAQSNNWAMANSNGGSDYDWGHSVASDDVGITVVVGAFYSSTITFGNTILNNPNGACSSFIVRYDINGNVIWAKQPTVVGVVRADKATGVAIDNFNNIYITGYYRSNSITFDTITLTKVNSTLDAYFIVKYNSSGNIMWAKTTNGEFNGSFYSTPFPYNDKPLIKIALNKSNGDIYLAGTFDYNTMAFGSTILTNATLDTGYYPRQDVFVAKFNSSGDFIWANSIGGQRQDFAGDISISNSNVYVTGAFGSPSLNIGSTILTNPNQPPSWDKYLPFLAKFDTSGNPVWAKQGEATITGNILTRGKNVVADINGICTMAGVFASTSYIVFENDTLFSGGSATYSTFIVQYDSLGSINWSKSFTNANGPNFPNGIQTDGLGNVYVAGTFQGNSQVFDTLTVFSLGGGTFVTKLSPSGNVLWVKKVDGDTQSEHILGLSVTEVGNVFITGQFKGNLYFGSDTLICSGLTDIFTAIILTCSPGSSVITAQSNTTFCQGDSVILSASPGYINYQWYRRNFAIPGATSMNYIAKGAGRYSCRSQNATLCIDTSNVIIVNVPCIPIGPNQERAIVQNEFERQRIGIYPNPSTGVFFVEDFSGQLNVFNYFGQMVLSTKVNDDNFKFDISNYANGIYFVTLNSGDSFEYQKILLLH